MNFTRSVVSRYRARAFERMSNSVRFVQPRALKSEMNTSHTDSSSRSAFALLDNNDSMQSSEHSTYDCSSRSMSALSCPRSACVCRGSSLVSFSSMGRRTSMTEGLRRFTTKSFPNSSSASSATCGSVLTPCAASEGSAAELVCPPALRYAPASRHASSAAVRRHNVRARRVMLDRGASNSSQRAKKSAVARSSCSSGLSMCTNKSIRACKVRKHEGLADSQARLVCGTMSQCLSIAPKNVCQVPMKKFFHDLFEER